CLLHSFTWVYDLFTVVSSATTHHIEMVLPTITTLFPYTTLFRSISGIQPHLIQIVAYPAVKAGTDFFKVLVFGKIGTRFHSWVRSEEHTSELQSRENLVCRLLLEKKKNG